METFPISAREAILLGTLWTVGFAAGLSRACWNGNYKSFGKSLSAGFVAGFFSLGLCNFHINATRDATDNGFTLVCLAGLYGLAGKEMATLLSSIYKAAYGRIFGDAPSKK